MVTVSLGIFHVHKIGIMYSQYNVQSNKLPTFISIKPSHLTVLSQQEHDSLTLWFVGYVVGPEEDRQRVGQESPRDTRVNHPSFLLRLDGTRRGEQTRHRTSGGNSVMGIREDFKTLCATRLKNWQPRRSLYKSIRSFTYENHSLGQVQSNGSFLLKR